MPIGSSRPAFPQQQWQAQPAAAWQHRGGAPSGGVGGQPNPLIQHQNQAWQAMYNPPPLQQPIANPPPQLPQGPSLAQLTQTLTPFPTMQYGLAGFPTPSLPGGPGAGAGASPLPASAPVANIGGGITMPQMPAQPNLQPPGQQGGALRGLLESYLSPMQNAAIGQWHTQAADLGNQAQQAQAQSGLGWGNLAGGMAADQQRLALARYQNLLSLLGAATGGLGQ